MSKTPEGRPSSRPDDTDLDLHLLIDQTKFQDKIDEQLNAEKGLKEVLEGDDS